MKKQKSIYEDNRKIMEDEKTYPDKNTVVLIDLLAEIIVKRTLLQLESNGDQKWKSQLPKIADQ